MSENVSGFLGGRLQLAQALRGHRVGMDAALLAAAAPREVEGLLLDAGAGVGAVGLAAARLAPRLEVGLIEIAPAATAMARRNIALNGLEARARLYEADLLSPAARREAGLVDETAAFVLTNPPFHAAGRVRVSPDPGRALAHVAAAPLGDWTRACLALLAPGGGFAMIHRADALGECLAALEGRLGALRILPVAPRAGAAAGRIVVSGVKGSKAPLALLAPLVLHEADGAFTPLADAIFRGEASLPGNPP
jgi:tRNA1(Val) A37 N6-methylase TrmN6